jgi:hypothetical protein
MNVFQLIKSVLDWEFDRIEAPTHARKIALINERHARLSDAYSDLTDKAAAPPDYSDPITRFAYIYKYTTCHADIVSRSISAFDELSVLFDGNEWLRVACIGGGPGSDFLGVLKYALLAGKTRSLKCFLLDRESAWGDTWSDVEEHTQDMPFKLSTHFQKLDVTDPGTWATQTKYRSAHLFTFIYFLSEVYRLDAAARGFFQNLVEHAESGAHFLFIDNDADDFIRQIERFSKQYGLRQIAGGSLNYLTDTNEEKTDLEPYFGELDDSPKIRARIYRAVMVKP